MSPRLAVAGRSHDAVALRGLSLRGVVLAGGVGVVSPVRQSHVPARRLAADAQSSRRDRGVVDGRTLPTRLDDHGPALPPTVSTRLVNESEDLWSLHIVPCGGIRRRGGSCSGGGSAPICYDCVRRDRMRTGPPDSGCRVKCRNCHGQRFRVLKTRYRPTDDAVIRRLECLSCGYRQRTCERHESVFAPLSK